MKYFLPFLLLVTFSSYAAEDPPTFSGKSNPCPEGAFLDVGESQCKTLDKPGFGFDRTKFNNAHPTATVEVSACTTSALKSAIATIKNAGGGTVNIPTCTITLTEELVIPSNTLVQGMGTDKTVLQITTSFPDNAFFDAGDRSNLIFRDIKFIGQRNTGDTRTIAYANSDNIMFERLDITKMSRAALTAAHTHQWTARYNNFLNNEGNSVGSKDCFPDGGAPKGSISRADCGSGDFWSYDLSWYSNRVIDPYNAGIDSHADDVEVAGNYVKNSIFAHGLKIAEPATRVWAHDNVIIDNEKNGINNKTQKCANVDQTMAVNKIVTYRNRIERNDLPGNGSNGFYVLFGRDIYSIDNIYRGNGANNTWSHNGNCDTVLLPAQVFLCPGNEITTANDVGNGSVTNLASSNSKCNLANIANIF